MNRFQCVADHQRRYGVKRLCSILGVRRSSFYYWRRTAVGRVARQAADASFTVRIRAVHKESDGTYGAPRITAELRETSGEAVNKRVARLMRASGIEGVRLRRRHRTTVPDPAAAKAPDLIGRDFTAENPNTRYVGDITYLPIDGGKSATWRPSSISPRAVWPAGRSPTTCARTSSPTPWPQRSARAAASSDRSCTPTTEPSTRAGHSPKLAGQQGSVEAGARSGPARTTHSPSPSTRPSNAKPCRDERAGQTSARPDSTPSDGSTATTPDADTPASDNDHPSPSKTPSTHTNYAGTSRIARVQDSGSRPKAG